MEEGGELADALMLAAGTEREALLGHLYQLHNGDRNERIRAALRLGQMEGLAADITPHLVEALVDNDSRVVQEAVTALGMIGPAAKGAIPALE